MTRTRSSPAVAGASPEFAAVETSADNSAFLIHTSGTTDYPVARTDVCGPSGDVSVTVADIVAASGMSMS